MSIKTISILIPALNEEKNIINLLNDIKEQITFGGFKIETVLVISDGSTDKTNELVSNFASDNLFVKLVINQKRLGKIFSVAKGYQILNTDYLIMFDADVRLADNTVLELSKGVLNNENAKLIAGNPIPLKLTSKFNIAEQASMFSWHIVQKIKSIQPNSIYSAHGRILMLSRLLYKNIDIESLSTPGDDQFIYLQAKESFKYLDKAIVYYKLPSSINDYLSQNLRFRRAQNMRLASDINLKDVFYIKNKRLLVIQTCFLHPLRFVLWFNIYIAGFIKYKFQSYYGNKGDVWGIAKSTK